MIVQTARFFSILTVIAASSSIVNSSSVKNSNNVKKYVKCVIRIAMAKERRIGRQKAVSDLKRGLILDAARKVFEADGLDGASLRAIAATAGYTPAALYFHFESKEAIYAQVLRDSLVSLGTAVSRAALRTDTPADRLAAAAMAFFRYYDDNPRDLDLGFYLFRGGMKPHGLGRERDQVLNAALELALNPIAEAAMALGARRGDARILVADVFAHVS